MAYNPSDHKAQNQPFGVGAIPLNAKSLYYDSTLFKYRPFQNIAEVNAYFANLTFRDATFDIIVNTGGTLNAGVITGGTNDAYWYKDGTANANLVLKTNSVDLTPYYTADQIDVFLSEINDTLDEHLSNYTNPHNTTAEQVGAPTIEEFDSEVSSRISADESLQLQINEKAFADDINTPVQIDYSDLVSNTYTNLDFANQSGIIIYYDPNGLQSAGVTFNSLGITTLPFTAEPEFVGTLIGVTGALGNFVRNSDIGTVVTSINLFNPNAEDMNYDTRVLSNGVLSYTPGSGNVTTGKIFVDPSTTYNFSNMSAAITKRLVYRDINDAVISVISFTPATVQFTTPVNVSYIYATVIDVSGTGGVLANVKLAKGTIAATDEYAASVITIKNQNIIASTINIDNVLVNPNLLQMKNGDLKVFISATPNTWYIRIPFSSTHDLVHTWGLDEKNIIPETKSVRKVPNTIADGETLLLSVAGTIHSPSDSVPPFRLDQGFLVGGGHVMGTPLVTLVAHGRASTLLTSKWTDGTYNWFLVDIPDANTMRFLPEQFLFAEGYGVPSTFSGNNLTYVSGGSGGDTSNINVTTRVNSEITPSTFDRSYYLLLDNAVISASGLYYGNELKIVDNHSLIDYRHITVQTPFVPNDGLPLLLNKVSYTYDKTNTETIDATIDFRAVDPVYIDDYPLEQAERAITSFEGANVTLLYMPNTGNISNGVRTINLATTPENIFNPIGGTSLIFGSGNIPDNTKAVNRCIEVQQTALGDKKNGFAQTFSYDLGVSDYATRKLLAEQWEIRGNSAKSYPRMLFDSHYSSQVLQGRVYRTYWDASLNPNMTAVYSYLERGTDFYYLFLDTHETLTKETVYVQKWLAGRSIVAIAETFGTISILNNDYIPESCELIINSDVTVNGYAYIVLKLK